MPHYLKFARGSVVVLRERPRPANVVRNRNLVSVEERAEHARMTATIPNDLTVALQEVIKVVSQQGKAIGELTNAVRDLMIQKSGPTAERPSKSKFKPRYSRDGQPICLRCEGVGHIARQCTGQRFQENPVLAMPESQLPETVSLRHEEPSNERGSDGSKTDTLTKERFLERAVDHEEVMVNQRSMTGVTGDLQCPLEKIQMMYPRPTGGVEGASKDTWTCLPSLMKTLAILSCHTGVYPNPIPGSEGTYLWPAQKHVIQESSSSYASPVVLVHATHSHYSRIDESLDALSKAKVFSSIDLASGYHQVAVHEKDRHKTAFITPFGLYEYQRMPFGLCNAPATFQRLMQTIMSDLVFQTLLVYLDDLLVYSSTFEGHLVRLEAVLQRLREAGLKVKVEKCHFLQSEVKFLGHVVSAQGVSTDPDKVSAVRQWPVPHTLKELRSFLGFCSYYRRFIEGFSKVAGPLHDVVNKCVHQGSVIQANKLFKGSWTAECQKALSISKRSFTCAPTLGYADFTLPFVLETDASNLGLGAVLYQQQGGSRTVIAYASRRLRGAERNDRNYSSMKLELLALKWAVDDLRQFQETDPTISVLKSFWDKKRKPTNRERKYLSRQVLLMLKQWDKIQEKDGLMYRMVDDVFYGECQQLLLPECLVETVLRSVHDQMGHQEVVAVDFTTLEPASDGQENVLVVTDVFTKFSQAFPTRNQKADTTARILLKEWFLKYGVPQRLHSDQGRNFESAVIAELWNAQCERFNRTLHDLLRSLPPEKKRRWPEYLPELVYAYNVTPHSSTGYSPYYMLFGRQPHLPVDALLGQEPDLEKELAWLSVHKERLRDAHTRAREYTERRAADRVAKREGGVYCPEVLVGQQLYLRYRPPGRNKIQDAWAPTVYQVVEVHGTTYTVEPVEGGPAKRVHRSGIRLCPRPVPMPRRKVRPVEEVPTSGLVDEMPSLDAECVLVEETIYPEESQQLGVAPFDCAGAEVEEAQETCDEAVSGERSAAQDSLQPDTERTDSPTDVVLTRPVPVPRKPRAENTQVDAPHPTPRRTQRSNAGVHSNPNRLPKSSCNAVSFTPDVLSQVLAGVVLYTSNKLQGLVDE
ncbi:uncharacterized protein LOC122357538 [Puntigrus tetrazona]|uniref:uncharacterized protein LOC122357538 n=1 Tax=Puntigrus tetrazona TaxID=1606681 RepID=UPI001C89CB6C|nr:uncharacterized protein LOC122357538 [Puntigrus tetrazona]